jgi:hypothetical protein
MNYVPTGDNLISVIRLLAKDSYWQTVYSMAKEMHRAIFENERDYSPIQFTFLGYLEFYNALYMDIALGDVTKIVLENEIYEDAYMYYQSKARKKDMKKVKNPDELDQQNSWVFKRPAKKK